MTQFDLNGMYSIQTLFACKRIQNASRQLQYIFQLFLTLKRSSVVSLRFVAIVTHENVNITFAADFVIYR